MPAIAKKKMSKKAMPKKRYSKKAEDLTEAELSQEILNLKPWDTDIEFFYDWCEEMGVFSYQEVLTRELKTQDIVGKVVGGLAVGLIVSSFFAALISMV